MSGVKGRSGGPRPNSGRPRKEVKDWQGHNLLIVRSVFTDDDVRQIAESLRRDLIGGNPDARKIGLAYIIGAAPREVTVLGDSESPVEVKQVGGSDDHIAEVLRVLADAGVLTPGTSATGNAPADQVHNPPPDA